MSSQTVYLAGYEGGRQPASLLAACQQLDAVVYDIRFSPYSRNPRWTRQALTAYLGRDRYVWVKPWGNVLYRSANDCQIADFEGGLDVWDAEARTVILLCRCPVSATCHRMVVARMLAGVRDVAIRDLDDVLAEAMGPGIEQLPLFGKGSH